ncbi:Nramp family divalent metal transporter [Duganella sp. sic0402]|uniref:Nramp family divalent metal transporter n=1 Tax=Duganella sp. sic0402 TaxID=2854786 RepID=UPI001C45DD9D|nr:Nramp family divalent metal transporter [Duganella sp. sic0402]MBV7534895.1 Nramp family divalent metal transporter [Duganella sp. sic0402]
MTPPVVPSSLEQPGVGVNGQRSVEVRQHGPWWRRFLSFVGPGYLVAVGYMDPGNWATDLAGGAAYGYSLLWIIGLSSCMAMLLQVLTARLGIVAQADLAQLSRQHSSRRSAFVQWLLCEVAICACDLAEVIGTAIALKLLFGIPLSYGVILTALDVFAILWLQQRGFRYLEAFVIALLGVIFICFAINLALAQPEWRAVAEGFLPSAQTVTDPGMLYLAIGIIGATVMPHNLYLHSSTVQTRRFDTSDAGKRKAISFATADIIVALGLACLVNAAILITSAAVFHTTGNAHVADLEEAYQLLGPLTGTALASILFGVALLASGLSSSVTATLAGQIVMEGFVQIRMPPWARRLITRSVAIVPALVVTLLYGDHGVTSLLLLSQVILSMQLPFAMWPLIRYASDRNIMGGFATPRAVSWLAWLMMAVIVTLNIIMVTRALTG